MGEPSATQQSGLSKLTASGNICRWEEWLAVLGVAIYIPIEVLRTLTRSHVNDSARTRINVIIAIYMAQ